VGLLRPPEAVQRLSPVRLRPAWPALCRGPLRVSHRVGRRPDRASDAVHGHRRAGATAWRIARERG